MSALAGNPLSQVLKADAMMPEAKRRAVFAKLCEKHTHACAERRMELLWLRHSPELLRLQIIYVKAACACDQIMEK